MPALDWGKHSFTEGALFADKQSPLLLTWIAEGEAYSDDVMLWEYVTAGNKTASFQSDRERLDANMEPDNRQIYPKSGGWRMIINGINGVPKQEELTPLPIKIIRIVGSSVLLKSEKDSSTLKITWQYLGDESEQVILQYTSYSNIVAFNLYFEQRVKFDMETGSLLLQNLEIVDSGLYQITTIQPIQNSEILHKHSYFDVQVQERLRSPQIIQNPLHARDLIKLTCIVGKSDVSRITWQKDNKPLNSTHMRLDFDNCTLSIQGMKVSDCGLYTCTVSNDVSQNSNSYFLTADGIFVTLIYAVVMSAFALVSGLTSLIAAAIVMMILEEPQGADYQRELTTIFVVFKLVSTISLLISCFLILSEAGIALWCRVVAGLECVLCIVVIIYISFFYLNLNTQLYPTFLLTKAHRYIILISGTLCVAVSSALVYEVSRVANLCRYPTKLLFVRSFIAVLIYVFPVILFVLFYIAHLQEVEMYVKLKAVKRATQHRLRGI